MLSLNTDFISMYQKEVGDFALLGGPPQLRLNPISADMQT
jgi:hypothetical protein